MMKSVFYKSAVGFAQCRSSPIIKAQTCQLGNTMGLVQCARSEQNLTSSGTIFTTLCREVKIQGLQLTEGDGELANDIRVCLGI